MGKKRFGNGLTVPFMAAAMGAGLLFVAGKELLPAVNISKANPYMTGTEFIPDGEPHVFEDPDNPGRYRVYIYGSRDERGGAELSSHGYCGYGHNLWSAPVEDLTNWTNHGEIFHAQQILNITGGSAPPQHLGAPDCVYNRLTKKYYLYVFCGHPGPDDIVKYYKTWVAESGRPDGQFIITSEENNWCKWPYNNDRGVFDPAVFADDDGKIYAYWGMTLGGSCMAELDPYHMNKIKPETLVMNPWGVYAFFEASSMRKVGDKYVFVYSANGSEPAKYGQGYANGETRLPAATLNYVYADHPLGNPVPVTDGNPYGRSWEWGGTIIDNRGRSLTGVTDADGNQMYSWAGGNDHGGMFVIKGEWTGKPDDQWYINYHRPAPNNFNRQAVIEPLNVSYVPGKGGRVTIEKAYMSCSGVELDGINAFQRYNASIVNFRTGGFNLAGDIKLADGVILVRHIGGDNSNNTVLGYEYLNFGSRPLSVRDDVRFKAVVRGETAIDNGCIKIYMTDPAADPTLASSRILLGQINFSINTRWTQISGSLDSIPEPEGTVLKLTGKRGIFLEFHTGANAKMEFREFEFALGNAPTPNPLHNIVTSKVQFGSVKASVSRAGTGESILLRAAGIDGSQYIAESMTVTNNETGLPLALHSNSDGSYEFKMPNAPVTVDASFTPASGGRGPASIAPAVDLFIKSEHGAAARTRADILAETGLGDNVIDNNNNISRLSGQLRMGSEPGEYCETLLRFDVTAEQRQMILNAAPANPVTLNMALNVQGTDKKTVYAYIIPADKTDKLTLEGSSTFGYFNYPDAFDAEITVREFLRKDTPAASVTADVNDYIVKEFDLTAALKAYFAQNPAANRIGIVLANTDNIANQVMTGCSTRNPVINQHELPPGLVIPRTEQGP